MTYLSLRSPDHGDCQTPQEDIDTGRDVGNVRELVDAQMLRGVFLTICCGF